MTGLDFTGFTSIRRISLPRYRWFSIKVEGGKPRASRGRIRRALRRMDEVQLDLYQRAQRVYVQADVVKFVFVDHELELDLGPLPPPEDA